MAMIILPAFLISGKSTRVKKVPILGILVRSPFVKKVDGRIFHKTLKQRKSFPLPAGEVDRIVTIVTDFYFFFKFEYLKVSLYFFVSIFEIYIIEFFEKMNGVENSRKVFAQLGTFYLCIIDKYPTRRGFVKPGQEFGQGCFAATVATYHKKYGSFTGLPNSLARSQTRSPLPDCHSDISLPLP